MASDFKVELFFQEEEVTLDIVGSQQHDSLKVRPIPFCLLPLIMFGSEF